MDVNGTKYEVQYDGSGNTNIVVQNGESPAVIAKKFGCTLEDLKSLNADKLHGKGQNTYFLVGDTIKSPVNWTQMLLYCKAGILKNRL